MPNGATNGSLTIGTDISLSADAILKVFGTLSVGTIRKFWVTAFCIIIAAASSRLARAANSAIRTGSPMPARSRWSATRSMKGQYANSGGTLHIDNGATLKLSSATAASTTITGGNLTLGRRQQTRGREHRRRDAGWRHRDRHPPTQCEPRADAPASLIEIGAERLDVKLDDATWIKNGNLTIAAGSKLDVENEGRVHACQERIRSDA